MAVNILVFRLEGARSLPSNRAAVCIRAACAHRDAIVIAEVVESCHGTDTPAPTAVGLLAELESRPGRVVAAWLACEGEHPAGLVTIVAAGSGPASRYSISWLLVGRPFRRRGVGAALIATALADARARGAREVWVETRAAWPDALKFWEAMGFTAGT